MRDTVLYVGNFFYPTGNAAGKRVYGNLKAISDSGYKTACLCFRRDDGKEGIVETVHDNTMLFTIPYTQGTARLSNNYPIRVFHDVMRKLGTQKVRMVIMYNSLGTTGFNLSVISICHKYGIKVAYDIVDYFDEPDRNNLLRYFMKKFELNRLVKRVIPGCDCWVTISSFLKNMMPDAKKTIIVPPLATEIRYEMRKPGTPITFSYATFIVDKNRPISEWKDRLDTVIDVFYLLTKEHPELSYRVKFIGFDEARLLEMFPENLRDEYSLKLKFIRGNIIYLQQMPNELVQSELIESDFLILLRDSKNCNNAGFPTKVSEAISLGVPVITNVTSDIDQYLEDGINSVIVDTPGKVQSISESVSNVLTYEETMLNKLRKNAYSSRPFYYKDYAEKFKKFIEEN